MPPMERPEVAYRLEVMSTVVTAVPPETVPEVAKPLSSASDTAPPHTRV